MGIQPNYEKLREILGPIAELQVFCLYKTKTRDGRPDKLDKIPYVRGVGGFELLRGGYKDPALAAKLMTLDEAIREARRGSSAFAGVGLIFSPNCGLVALDVDNCIDPETGKVKLMPEQRSAWELLAPYAAIEKSVSGTGVHFLVLGNSGNIKAPGELEVFGESGFIALTGAGGIGTIREAPPEVLAKVGELVDQRKEAKRDRNAVALTATKPAYSRADADQANDEALGRRTWPAPTVDVIRSALAHIPAAVADGCDRDTWRNVVWAVRDALGNDGKQVALEWSQTAPADFDARSFANVWNSDRGNGIKVATMYHKAMNNGWSPPWHQHVTLPAVTVTDDGQPAVVAETLPVTQTLNDTGNAARLFKAADGGVRYDLGADCWVVFRDRWIPDKHGLMANEAGHVLRGIYDEAREANDSDTAKRVAAWGSRSLDRPRIEAALALLKATPGIPFLPHEADADPMVIQTADGWHVDLRNGQARRVTKGDMMIRTVGTTWAPDARCPLWERSLSEMFEGDMELVSLMQRTFGYYLTGSTREQVFVFLYGTGANGKSLLLSVIRKTMGDYAKQVPAKLYMSEGRNAESAEKATPQLARLIGARLAISSEVEDGSRLDEAKVKELTGGDVVVARGLNAAPVEIPPTAKHIMACNHKPVIRGDDQGIWRRVVLIPFNRQFSESERDKELESKLTAELPGILNWGLAGTREWLARGLAVPERVRQEVSTYRTDSDVMGQWLGESVQPTEGGEIGARRLYTHFADWCRGGGHGVLSEKRFADKMASRGTQKFRTNKGAIYQGIGLKPAGAATSTGRAAP
ncbi:MAG TPA: phage/plasmid primase, P4 family [Ottowia sp.]|nr:phage/plasmid primase, P4 family [Ottowia sp.]